MSDLKDLLESVEKATGEDRELDESFAVSFRLTAGDEPAEHYTASIDSALALVEKVRPGWTWSVGLNQWHKYAFATLRTVNPTGTDTAVEIPEYSGQHGTSAPLAILAALLKSLIAEPANADT